MSAQFLPEPHATHTVISVLILNLLVVLLKENFLIEYLVCGFD